MTEDYTTSEPFLEALAENTRMNQIQKFFDAMMKKFRSKDDYPGNATTPWDTFAYTYLLTRLNDEFQELMDSVKVDSQGIALSLDPNELLDVANFCLFLWIKNQGEK